MRVLLDLNVLLDVVQNRAPHYEDSAKVLSLARLGEVHAVLPVHAFTTLYSVVSSFQLPFLCQRRRECG